MNNTVYLRDCADEKDDSKFACSTTVEEGVVCILKVYIMSQVSDIFGDCARMPL